MNKLLLALGALLAGALLIPDMAEAQRGGRGGGGPVWAAGGWRRRLPGWGQLRRRRLRWKQDVYSSRRRRRSRGRNGQPGLSWCGNCCAPGPRSRHWPRWPLRQPHRQRPLRRALLWSLRALPLLRRALSVLWRILWGLSVLWRGCRAGHGQLIGAAATYPYYNYPYSTYQTPVASADGGYCATSVRTCALTNSAAGRDRMLLPHLGRQSPRHS